MIIQNQNFSSQHVQALLDEAERLGLNSLINSPEGFTRFRRLSLDLAKQQVRAQDYLALLRVVQREQVKYANRPNYLGAFRPQPAESDIGIWPIKLPFRCTDSGAALSLSHQHIARGVGLYGPLGIGKTTAACHILSAFMREHIPCVIWDKKGHETEFLRMRYPVLVLTPGKDFYLNPFECDFYEAILMGSIILNVFSRKDSHSIAQAAISQFFSEHSQNDILTFQKFVNLIPAAKPICWKSFNPALYQSISNVMSSIMNSPLVKVFDCVHGLNISEMLAQGVSLIIQTANLTSQIEELLICIIAEKIYSAIEQNPNIPDYNGIKAGLYIDEASEYISEKLDRDQRHLSPLASYYLKARSRGIANIFSCHNPSRISSVMKSSLHVQFCGHLISDSDIRTVKDSMGLNNEQALSLMHLEIGEFCVKLGSGYTMPFIVKVDPLNKENP